MVWTIKVQEKKGCHAMNVMIDTNIIIDIMLNREPFVRDSAAVLRLCSERYIKGFITASLKDFKHSPVSACTPDYLLERFTLCT